MIETKDILLMRISIRHFCQISPVHKKDFLSLKTIVSRKYLLFIDTFYYNRSSLLEGKYNISLQGNKINFLLSISKSKPMLKPLSKARLQYQNHCQNQEFWIWCMPSGAGIKKQN
jgi:hypothetical protein